MCGGDNRKVFSTCAKSAQRVGVYETHRYLLCRKHVQSTDGLAKIFFFKGNNVKAHAGTSPLKENLK